jgi:hypothetical protein
MNRNQGRLVRYNISQRLITRKMKITLNTINLVASVILENNVTINITIPIIAIILSNAKAFFFHYNPPF